MPKNPTFTNDPENDLPFKVGAPAERALTEAGYTRLAQVAELSEKQVKKLHGMGPNAFRQLRDALHARGLSFADEM